MASNSVETNAAQNIPKVSRLISKLLSPESSASTLFQIEDTPQGYSRFSALIASHPSFCICRRFSTVRARLLLLKQDHISVLEAQLEQIDHEETKPLFLGNARRDTNEKRKETLAALDTALADYDGFVKRCREVLEAPQPKPHHITSLQNWVDSTGCIAKPETDFLRRDRDLMAVAKSFDDILSYIQVLLVKATWCVCSLLRSSHFNISRDPKVFISSSSLAKRISQLIIVSFAVAVLLVPVIVINLFNSWKIRQGVAAIGSSVFIFVLTFLINAHTKKIFVAGATYAAVLVVFIAGNNDA